jgi:hypothetical protein
MSEHRRLPGLGSDVGPASGSCFPASPRDGLGPVPGRGKSRRPREVHTLSRPVPLGEPTRSGSESPRCWLRWVTLET